MRTSDGAARDGEEGYVLLALLVTSAVLLAGLALAIPRMALQSQRVKDEQLIERGEQYRRAIELYFRTHNRYPEELDDLEDTDDVRYLRRRHADPIGETGEWRLIHMGTDGRFEDSLLFDTAKDRRADGSGEVLGGPGGGVGLTSPPPGSQFAPGTNNTPGLQPGAGAALQQDPYFPRAAAQLERFQAVRESAAPDLTGVGRYNQGFEFGAEAGDPAPVPEAVQNYGRLLPNQVPMDENERRFLPQDPSSASAGAAPGLQPAPASGSGDPRQGLAPGLGPPEAAAAGSGAPEMINRLLTTPRPGGITGPNPQGQPEATVQRFERGIAGVASRSKASGVKVYQGKQRYNEWEFVYDYRQGAGAAGTSSGVQPGLASQSRNQQSGRRSGTR